MQFIESVEISDFEWDEGKRLRTLDERHIDFTDAANALLLPHLEQPSNRNDEVRTLAICQTSKRVIAAVYTMRSSVCRIISVRPARKNEQATYRQIFGG